MLVLRKLCIKLMEETLFGKVELKFCNVWLLLTLHKRTSRVTEQHSKIFVVQVASPHSLVITVNYNKCDKLSISIPGAYFMRNPWAGAETLQSNLC